MQEKADTEQEHNALSHMTSDPTTAIDCGDPLHDPYVNEGWRGPSAELGGVGDGGRRIRSPRAQRARDRARAGAREPRQRRRQCLWEPRRNRSTEVIKVRLPFHFSKTRTRAHARRPAKLSGPPRRVAAMAGSDVVEAMQLALKPFHEQADIASREGGALLLTPHPPSMW